MASGTNPMETPAEETKGLKLEQDRKEAFQAEIKERFEPIAKAVERIVASVGEVADRDGNEIIKSASSLDVSSSMSNPSQDPSIEKTGDLRTSLAASLEQLPSTMRAAAFEHLKNVPSNLRAILPTLCDIATQDYPNQEAFANRLMQFAGEVDEVFGNAMGLIEGMDNISASVFNVANENLKKADRVRVETFTALDLNGNAKYWSYSSAYHYYESVWKFRDETALGIARGWIKSTYQSLDGLGDLKHQITQGFLEYIHSTRLVDQEIE